jgi:hypothetical protein
MHSRNALQSRHVSPEQHTDFANQCCPPHVYMIQVDCTKAAVLFGANNYSRDSIWSRGIVEGWWSQGEDGVVEVLHSITGKILWLGSRAANVVQKTRVILCSLRRLAVFRGSVFSLVICFRSRMASQFIRDWPLFNGRVQLKRTAPFSQSAMQLSKLPRHSGTGRISIKLGIYGHSHWEWNL